MTDLKQRVIEHVMGGREMLPGGLRICQEAVYLLWPLVEALGQYSKLEDGKCYFEKSIYQDINSAATSALAELEEKVKGE